MDRVEITSPGGVVLPTAGKKEGGSHFDDELQTAQSKTNEFWEEMARLIDHLNQRPDHDVYVGSAEERGKLRSVFNHWKRQGKLGHNPNIRIDYGVQEGGIRVGDGR